MKEKPKGEGSGWHEPPDPTCIGKDGKAKARKHHDVVVKKEANSALNKPMSKNESKEPEKEELHIVVDTEKLLNLRDFCDENRIEFKMDEHFDIMEGVAVYITTPEAKAECDALLEFLDRNQIVEGIIEDSSTSSDLAQKVIGKVQERRSESAKAKDSSRTAKNVGDKEDAEDLVDWVKNPAKSDLQGVDTKK